MIYALSDLDIDLLMKIMSPEVCVVVCLDCSVYVRACVCGWVGRTIIRAQDAGRSMFVCTCVYTNIYIYIYVYDCHVSFKTNVCVCHDFLSFLDASV